MFLGIHGIFLNPEAEKGSFDIQCNTLLYLIALAK